MTISIEEVRTVAHLARLEVDDKEAAQLKHDLAEILQYVDKLNELDTKGVVATAQVSVLQAPLRPDVPQQGLTKEAALEQAPRADELGFLVPGFVD